MNENEARRFLGEGISFPIRVDKNTGKMVTSSEEENIKEAIRIILGTRRGERIRNPEFGCGIWDYAFSTMDYTSLSAMQREVEIALVAFEPRIEEIRVEVEPVETEGRVIVHISYVVRKTNNPFNLVFPFYLDEGFGE